MNFPQRRMRRLRSSDAIRQLVSEVRLAPEDLIFPMFVTTRPDVREPLGALPGMMLLSGAPLAEEAKRLLEAGIRAVLLFAVLDEPEKEPEAGLSRSPRGPVQHAIESIKAAAPEMTVIADLCMCEYSTDGHCGVLRDGVIDNDLTLERLQPAAVSLAQAGADVVAPSGMMDGVVGALRSALDSAGMQRTLLMPYAAKYASSLYGPFKSATRSAPAESRHATHQLDPANLRQALEEIRLDLEEGADMLIVKPALGYLDVVAAARREFNAPIAAYQVSGEYNMIHAAAGGDEQALERLILEMLTCIKRAGADMIITYFAPLAARVLRV